MNIKINIREEAFSVKNITTIKSNKKKNSWAFWIFQSKYNFIRKHTLANKFPKPVLIYAIFQFIRNYIIIFNIFIY